jgi:hypothetical protein
VFECVDAVLVELEVGTAEEGDVALGSEQEK